MESSAQVAKPSMPVAEAIENAWGMVSFPDHELKIVLGADWRWHTNPDPTVADVYNTIFPVTEETPAVDSVRMALIALATKLHGRVTIFRENETGQVF